MRLLLLACLVVCFLTSGYCAVPETKNAVRTCLEEEAGIPGLTTEQCLAFVEFYEELLETAQEPQDVQVALQALVPNMEVNGGCNAEKLQECDDKGKQCIEECKDSGNVIACAWCFGSALASCCDCYGSSVI
ncbi:hypothetical protein QOT17_023030 [Balamuthia mandrillaris]